MSTRIRYKKQLDGTLVSKVFKTPTDEVFATIVPFGGIFINSLDGKLFQQSEEHYSNLQNAKKAVKKALIALGVNFTQEVRPRLKKLEGDDINQLELFEYESNNFGDK